MRGEEEVMQDDEHCLSIVWNLLVALSTEQLSATEKICLERISFKLLEGSFEKFKRLRDLHEQVYSRLSEFDLDEFKTSEEIGYLENDYNLDLLSLVDCLLLYTSSSETCKRLLRDQGHPEDSVRSTLENELQDQISVVVRVHSRRLDESAS